MWCGNPEGVCTGSISPASMRPIQSCGCVSACKWCVSGMVGVIDSVLVVVCSASKRSTSIRLTQCACMDMRSRIRGSRH